MTTETKHTPTPWIIDGGQAILARRPKGWKATPQHPRYIVTQTALYTSPDRRTAEANAAHIVRCVNSHDALVDVSKWVVSAFEGGAKDIPAHVYTDAVEALKQAGVE